MSACIVTVNSVRIPSYSRLTRKPEDPESGSTETKCLVDQRVMPQLHMTIRQPHNLPLNGLTVSSHYLIASTYNI